MPNEFAVEALRLLRAFKMIRDAEARKTVVYVAEHLARVYAPPPVMKGPVDLAAVRESMSRAVAYVLRREEEA